MSSKLVYRLSFIVYRKFLNNLSPIFDIRRVGDVTINQIGQSLIEAIVVLAAGVVVIGALTFASISSLRNAQLSKNQAQASKLAQEGLDWVRTGRDRNACIRGLSTINSWSGSSATCSGTTSFWSYQISGASNCGASPNSCYFTVDSNGVLTNIAFSASSFPTSLAEPVGNFRRAVIITDLTDGTYNAEKQVSVIVTWVDFSGTHQSQLTTYLRSI